MKHVSSQKIKVEKSASSSAIEVPKTAIPIDSANSGMVEAAVNSNSSIR